MVPGGKRGRVCGVALGLILLLTTGLAEAFPQVKVDGIAPLAGSRVRIQASFLDRLGRAVPIDQLSRIVISRKDGRSRPVPVAAVTSPYSLTDLVTNLDLTLTHDRM